MEALARVLRGDPERTVGSVCNRTDVELVSRFQDGHEDAFPEIYRRYIARVNGYLRIALPNRSDVADVAQRVFASVFEALGEYRSVGRGFEPWLLRIVRNEAIDHIRCTRRTSPHAPEDLARLREGRDKDQHLAAQAWGSDARLHSHMRGLTESQRQILVLHYVAGLRACEIAAITGQTASAVRQTHRRALKLLEARLLPARD